jgi:hypothetical protein
MTDDSQLGHVEDGAREATDEERLAGILDQVRGDVALGHEGDAVQLLRQRLDDTGVVVSDEQFEALLLQVRGTGEA